MARTQTQQQLSKRLAVLPLDIDQHAVAFSERLRREQGWSHSFTARVIAEYRRFLLLAATTESVSVPSEAVDQAWHLHLLDTRAYWHTLCAATLGIPLHHTPSRGGDAEQAHYRERYAKTIERYREAFDCAPPSDIWPAASERFSGRYRRVDLDSCWVIRKRAFPRRAMMGAGLVSLLGCASAGSWNGTANGVVFIGIVVALVAALGILASRRKTERKDRSSGGGSGCGTAGGCSCPGGDGGGGCGAGCGGGGGCGGS